MGSRELHLFGLPAVAVRAGVTGASPGEEVSLLGNCGGGPQRRVLAKAGNGSSFLSPKPHLKTVALPAGFPRQGHPALDPPHPLPSPAPSAFRPFSPPNPAGSPAPPPSPPTSRPLR